MKFIWVWETDCHTCSMCFETIVPLFRPVIRTVPSIRYEKRNTASSRIYNSLNAEEGTVNPSRHQETYMKDIYEKSEQINTPTQVFEKGDNWELYDMYDFADPTRYDKDLSGFNMLYEDPKRVARSILQKLFRFYITYEVSLPADAHQWAIDQYVPDYEHRTFHETQWKKAFRRVQEL